MKKLLIASLIFTLISCGSGETNIENCAREGTLFGDSISASYDAGTKLQKLVNIPVVNLATGGETTSNSLEGSLIVNTYKLKYTNFYNYIDNTSSKLIIIRYGAADAVLIGNYETTYSNLTKMVKYVKASNKYVVLVGVTGFSDPTYVENANRANFAIQKVARETSTKFVDIRSISYSSNDTVDGIHPTFEYSDKQINLIADSIKEYVCTTAR